MRTIKVSDVEKFAARAAPRAPPRGRDGTVVSILRDVHRNGDAAVKKYEKRFGGARIGSLRVSPAEIRRAYSETSEEQLDTVRLAMRRLERTETAVLSRLRLGSVSGGGTRIDKRFVPLKSVGCYVPGGLARYPSSAIMSIVPARVAGVRRIAAVSPPRPDGTVDPLTVVAADICGATEIYKTGGAQAIAALAYGTKSVRPVDKIVGPGGPFVTAAKHLVSDRTGIDMLAGPTELGIIADGTADPRLVALDLISQAEHSTDTLCYVITTSARTAAAVNGQLEALIPSAARSGIAGQSLQRNGFVAVCKSRSAMAALAEELAPEHLQIMARDPQALASKITSPGLVLLGPQTPSAASDYLLGSNHILPTGGTGRTRGPLSVLDFVKISTVVSQSRASLQGLAKHLKIFAEAEGLHGHYDAVRGRLD